jgi:hypothetical protein
MVYHASVLKLLISTPSDVLPQHLSEIRKVISQWNINSGESVGLVILPVLWTEHAVAEFGDRPQALLNTQIVKDADLGIAIFRDKLGTPTGAAVSGTAEEIQTLAGAGKLIGVFFDETGRPPLADKNARTEFDRLMEYRTELQASALTFSFKNSTDLVSCVNNFLSKVARDMLESSKTSIDISDSAPQVLDPGEGVWPSGEKDGKKSYLVLENKSSFPADIKQIEFTDLPLNALFRASGAEGEIGIIPPGDKVRFKLLLAMGSPKSVKCTVTWVDVNGEERKTLGTVRA